MLSINRPLQLRLGIAPGVPPAQLAALLARQRQEEPEADISFHEVSHEALVTGLRAGRYDAGLTLQDAADSALDHQPLWYESVAVAMPPRSPLLEKAALTLDDLLDSPIFRWQDENCPLLDQQLRDTSPAHAHDVQRVTSFELLAVWVTAGYGVGITAQSRITRARAWDICMCPLADAPYEVITYLVQPAGHPPSSHERFGRRARQILSPTARQRPPHDLPGRSQMSADPSSATAP